MCANVIVELLPFLGSILIFTAQVIICTSIKDTVEFLDHVMHVTNMSCLTPRTLLQVHIFVKTSSVTSCNVTVQPHPTSTSTHINLTPHQPHPTSTSPHINLIPLPLQSGCRFVAANLYAKSVSPNMRGCASAPLLPPLLQVFGEDALLNISVEREASGAVAQQCCA